MLARFRTTGPRVHRCGAVLLRRGRGRVRGASSLLLWPGPAPGVLRPRGGAGRPGRGGLPPSPAAGFLRPRASPERRAQSRPGAACSSKRLTGSSLIPEKLFLLPAALRLVHPGRQGGIWAAFGRNSPRRPCPQRCLLVFSGSVARPGALFAAEASVGLVTGPAERRRHPLTPGQCLLGRPHRPVQVGRAPDYTLKWKRVKPHTFKMISLIPTQASLASVSDTSGDPG